MDHTWETVLSIVIFVFTNNLLYRAAHVSQNPFTSRHELNIITLYCLTMISFWWLIDMVKNYL